MFDQLVQIRGKPNAGALSSYYKLNQTEQESGTEVTVLGPFFFFSSSLSFSSLSLSPLLLFFFFLSCGVVLCDFKKQEYVQEYKTDFPSFCLFVFLNIKKVKKKSVII